MSASDNVVPFHEAAGFHRFDCKDCEIDVTVFNPHDSEPVCAICRFIRDNPGLPQETVDRLRGISGPSMLRDRPTAPVERE